MGGGRNQRQFLTLIYNLQLLRAVAAAMVVAHHARDGITPAFPEAANVIIGAAGVDVFFVLSGVVITLAERQSSSSPGAFMMRRAVRVIPMYWLALATIGLLLMAGLSPIGVVASDATVSNMLRSMFLVPFERAHGAVMPLLGVGWTLNYEAFFYAIFAAMMFLPASKRLPGVLGALCLCAAIGLISRPSNVAIGYYTNPILLEFAAGVALAHLWSARKVQRRSDAALGVGMIIAAVGLLIWHASYDGFDKLMMSRVVVFGLPAVLCVWGAMLLERGGFAVRNPALVLLGAASYVLYLFHAIILQCIDVLARTLNLPMQTAPVAIAVAVFGFVLVHLIAIWLHLYVEKPLTAALRGTKALTRPV